MRVFVVLNMRGTAMGLLGKALAEAACEVQYCAAYCGEKLAPSPEGYSGLIVMGGEQNALDDDACPYFPELLALIRAFEAEGKPVLGICLGSQLIARAFDGKNIVGGAEEFSWSEIQLTEEGMQDPLLSSLPISFRQFQWHDDTFSLPAGATRLAKSPNVQNEAFRIGQACYGFQFHSEVGTALVYDWSTMYRDIILKNHPEWLAGLNDEAHRHANASDAISWHILKGWVSLLKAS